jgi:hypothetical protein
MPVFDFISLWLGRVIICSCVTLAVILIIYLVHSYARQTARFYWLLTKASKRHKLNDGVLKRIWFVFIKSGVDLALMREGTAWRCGMWFFSTKEMYVINPD